MGENLEKFGVEERVRFLILKHKGMLTRVVEESGTDLAYVQQVATKLKKKRDHDIACQVATTISMEIIDGHSARVAHLRDAMYQMQLNAAQRLSQCCQSPVRIYSWGKTDALEPGNYELHFICSQCQNECVACMPGVDLGEYRRLLNQWLLEDQSLAKFAETMGLTFKEDQPNIIHKHYNVAMINNNTPGDTSSVMPERRIVASHQLDAEGTELVKQAGELTPVTRELLRKSLEEKMLESKEGA